MKFFRPKAMYIEKSYDWGESWKIMRYFAADCEKSFPEIPKGAPRSLDDVVCQERYSKITPGTKGPVIYRVLPPNVSMIFKYILEIRSLKIQCPLGLATSFGRQD